MRFGALSSFVLAASLSLSVNIRAETPLPSSWVPDGIFLVARIAHPGELQKKLAELNPPESAPILQQLVGRFLGIQLLEGIDVDRAWYLFMGKGEPDRRGPWVLLPLSDESLFHMSTMERPPSLQIHSDKHYALLGRRPLPRLGGRFLTDSFKSDVEVQADLSALVDTFKTELEQRWAVAELLEDRSEQGMKVEAAVEDWQLPFSLNEMIERLQPDVENLSRLVQQCNLLRAGWDVTEGKLRWSLELNLAKETELGKLVAEQRPKTPAFLDRLNPDLPVVFWANVRLSDYIESHASLLSPLVEWIPSPEIIFPSEMLYSEWEAAWAVGQLDVGTELEAFVIPGNLELKDYRTLLKERSLSKDQGDRTESESFEPAVSKLDGYTVDRSVQFVTSDGEAETRIPSRTYYGWGEEQVLIASIVGDRNDSGTERLEKLVSRAKHPLPPGVREVLDQIPEKLLFMSWTDQATLIRRARKSDLEGVLHDVSDLPPFVFYATSSDSQLEIGSWTDLGRINQYYQRLDSSFTEARTCNETGSAYYFGRGVQLDYAEAAKWYRKAAEMGYAEAQANLGLLYESGKGVEQDYGQAGEWYRKAAVQDNPRAQTNLGWFYESGQGVPKDYAEAVRWYRKAAEQGHARAQNNLAWLYESGRGVLKNHAEAARWYQKAAEQGYTRAQTNLGNLYQNGRGVEKDFGEARKWFEKAVQQEDSRARAKLGYMYEKGQGLPEDMTRAVELYQNAAEAGNRWAQNRLGDMYEEGRGVTQDFVKSAQWYRKAAEQGHLDAQFQLGWYYESATGVEENYIEAEKWYRKAAEQGDDVAQCFLGELFLNGHGVARDIEEAFEWLTKSGDQGYTRAQNILGSTYFGGDGVPKDFDKAFEWFRKSAEQNDDEGQFQLGYMYEKGLSVPQDYAEALALYRKADEQGYSWAQARIGLCFEHGRGVQQNYAEAATWYRKAAENDNPQAQYNLARLLSRGWGVTQDASEAEKWLLKAADLDYLRALTYLGFIYEMGYGVPIDVDKAGMWYQKAAERGEEGGAKALRSLQLRSDETRQVFEPSLEEITEKAEQGFAPAQALLGLRYERGDGVEVDPELASKWYLKAAEQNGAAGQLGLGHLYLKGLGVPLDFVQAYFWLSAAMETAPDNGRAEAERLRNEILPLMTEDQVAEAEELLAEWREKR